MRLSDGSTIIACCFLREFELLHVTKEEETGEGFPSQTVQSAANSDQFDPSRFIRLVPPFRETEVDAYFTAIERVAGKFQWLKDMWALSLQRNLVGKAQEVCAANIYFFFFLKYDLVKTSVL